MMIYSLLSLQFPFLFDMSRGPFAWPYSLYRGFLGEYAYIADYFADKNIKTV
jgi:hypothetical protein